MSMRKTCAIFCVLPLLAACGVGNANGERAERGGPVESAGSVTVVRYCEKFAEEYLEREAIDYTGLSVRTEKQPDIMTWLSPARPPTRHIDSFEHQWHRIRNEAGLPGLRIHDLRNS